MAILTHVNATPYPSISTRSDVEIRANVAAELHCCPDIDDTDIAVEVRGGIVTLTGYVRSFFQKCGAEDAVKRVRGVTTVVNDLVARAPDRRHGSSDPDSPA